MGATRLDTTTSRDIGSPWLSQAANDRMTGSGSMGYRGAMPLIYLIAGEQSGDEIGAGLMRAVRARQPDARFAGIGGTAMAAEGLATLFPMRDLALMGLIEVLPRLRQLKQRLRQAINDIAARRPDVVVTID